MDSCLGLRVPVKIFVATRPTFKTKQSTNAWFPFLFTCDVFKLEMMPNRKHKNMTLMKTAHLRLKAKTYYYYIYKSFKTVIGQLTMISERYIHIYRSTCIFIEANTRQSPSELPNASILDPEEHFQK